MRELVARVAEAARRKGAGRVLIHLPAGLASLALEMAERLEGRQVLFWSEPCFGACDVPDLQAKRLGCDLIVSVGHAPMGRRPRLAVPVVFVEYEKGKPEDLVIPEISGKRISLAASNQFVHLLPAAKRILEKQGKKVLIGRSGPMCSHDGQVTGCDFAAATSVAGKSDAVLILGEGDFHSSGLAEACAPLPVYRLDPMGGRIEKIEPKKDSKINFIYEKERFGILVSAKPGQEHMALAKGVKRRLDAMGKTSIILAGDSFSPAIRNFAQVQALITAACPRLRDDDEAYGLPILSAADVLGLPPAAPKMRK